MFMEKITETAYAKINLGLDVLGKRADGYHEVSMVMQSISLADTVTLEKHSGLVVQTGRSDLPGRPCRRQQRRCGSAARAEPFVAAWPECGAA